MTKSKEFNKKTKIKGNEMTTLKAIGKGKVTKGLIKEFLIQNEWSNSFANKVDFEIEQIETEAKNKIEDLLVYVK